MAKSHKTCMEQGEIIDTFGTYQAPMTSSANLEGESLKMDGRVGGLYIGLVSWPVDANALGTLSRVR